MSNATPARPTTVPDVLEAAADHTAAAALGQLVAGGALTATVVTETLEQAAADAGLGEHEARTTIGSGLKAGAKRPRTVAA